MAPVPDTDGYTSAFATGASLVPVIVIVRFCVAELAVPSFTVTG